MRIYMERSGGLIGRTVKTAVDTTTLPADEARDLHQMIDATHFFELPSVLENDGGPDRFDYKLTVETPERQHTVRTSEMAAPDELHALVRRLELLDRSQRKRKSDTASSRATLNTTPSPDTQLALPPPAETEADESEGSELTD